MVVLPLASTFEKLQLTVTSAEIVLTSLKNETEIVLSSEISSLPTYNCNMVFRKSDTIDAMIGQMCFRSARPLVTADMVVSYDNFEKLEIFILGKSNKYQEIKKFNCNKCSMTLLIYYDIEKAKYFVNGERLEELRNSSTDTKKDIRILKQKLFENDNEQIKDYLKINIIKEEEELNHLTQKEKELTKNAAKENTQV